MSLIDCPECGERVSSYASACPHCGFPVAEDVQHAVEDVSGVGSARAFRHRAAAHKLEEWAESTSQRARGTARDRGTKIVIGIVVSVVVILQLMWVYSAVVR